MKHTFYNSDKNKAELQLYLTHFRYCCHGATKHSKSYHTYKIISKFTGYS
jgi:hypothetical protein